MHKIVISAFLFLTVFSLFSCDSPHLSDNGKEDEKPSNSFILTAAVKAIDNILTVEVISGEYASGIYSVIIADNAKLSDKEGNSITLSEISEGDTVKILYNGQTMLSYPPQIVALEVILQ